jgi:hypothetical protein
MGTGDRLFAIPGRAETYVRDITQRCEELIEGQIWLGIDIPRLRAWLATFTTPTEKYFAARILDALIFRSDAQTTALMIQLFQRSLPDLIRRGRLPTGPMEDWLSRLRDLKDDPGIRIVPVIAHTDPPTKSGPLVCRLMKRHLRLNDKWMIWPAQIEKARRRGIRTFVFVDDFLGTGYQFRKFIATLHLAPRSGNECFIYAPLVAHEKGIDRLRKRLPFIHVASVEQLDDSYNLFSPASVHFNDGENTPELAKAFYLSLLQERGVVLGRLTLGYSRLSLAFAFHHATPNASLPILWLPHPKLSPLLSR